MWSCDRAGKPIAPLGLEHTSVDANIAGFGARVTVRQTFTNPSKSPIEAVYTFPLPNDAAVDSMRIKIGNRVVEGKIEKRAEARRIYNEARQQGRVAALLDQERQNVFTQSVANIMPGAKIEVEIGYAQMVKYDGGRFEFTFPMVVGPRFTTGRAPDPSAVTPPTLPPNVRSGQHIDLKVHLDAGARIQSLDSVLHKIDTRTIDDSKVELTLSNKSEIPNRDFILRYSVATDTVKDAFWSHFTRDKGGFFTLAFMPPKRPTPSQIAAKQVMFVMDQSGSQSGFPIEKSKELTLKLIERLRPNDTFNVMGFNTEIRTLWPEARPNTPKNIAVAKAFIGGMEANGGTHVLEGTVAALQAPPDPSRLRVVLFNTDGYVDNELEILRAIRLNRGNARMFTFGIGNSVNRYLIDGMSEEGRGASEIVTLNEAADNAVDRLVKRLETPVLTDVHVAFDGISVEAAMPTAVPDLFDEAPIIIHGRYRIPGSGRVTVTGKLGGKPWSRTFDVHFGSRAESPSVVSLWARRRVDSLDAEAYCESLSGMRSVKNAEAEKVALEFGIMSAYTSFVAVDDRVVNEGGVTKTIRVPVEMADGVTLQDEEKPFAFSRGTIAAGTAGIGRSFGGASLSAKAMASSPQAPSRSKLQTKLPAGFRGGNGVVKVELILTDARIATLAKVDKLGFHRATLDKGKFRITGSCLATELIKIADLDEVVSIRFVE